MKKKKKKNTVNEKEKKKNYRSFCTKKTQEVIFASVKKYCASII